MTSRFGDRRDQNDRHRADDEIQQAVIDHFGRPADEFRGPRRVVIDDLELLHAPTLDPPFVLVPECGRCGTRAVDQFTLEQWRLLDAEVLGQAATVCRDCRFRSLPRQRVTTTTSSTGVARAARSVSEAPSEVT